MARDVSKIKSDIEERGVVTRLDIFEVLENSKGQTSEQKTLDVETFLESLPQGIKEKVGKDGKVVKESILADIGSYITVI